MTQRQSLRNYAACMTTKVNGDFANLGNTADMRVGGNSFYVAFSYQPPESKVKLTNPVGTGVICELGNYATNGFLVYLNNNTLNVYTGISGSSQNFGIAYFWLGDCASWHRYVITMNASDLRGRVYKDGLLVNTSTPQTIWTMSTSGNLLVGAGATLGTASSAWGPYQEFTFGTGAPTLADVQADYYQGITLPGAIHRWKMDETSGTTVHDTGSGTTSNGTLSGGASFTTNNAWLRTRGT